MKIAVPEGLQIDAQPGESTELLAKFKLDEENQLTLISLDGVPVEVEDEEGDEDISDEELGALLAGIEAEDAQATEMPSAEEFIASKDY